MEVFNRIPLYGFGGPEKDRFGWLEKGRFVIYLNRPIRAQRPSFVAVNGNMPKYALYKMNYWCKVTHYIFEPPIL